MHEEKYKEIIKGFSRFWQLDNGKLYLKSERKLEHNLEEKLKKYPKWEEKELLEFFWSIIINYNRNKPRNNNKKIMDREREYAHLHLIAYIHYKILFFMLREYSKLSSGSSFTIEKDYDEINQVLYNPEKFTKICQKYNLKHSSGANKITYWRGIISNILKNSRSQISDERLLCNVDLKNPKKLRNREEKLKNAIEIFLNVKSSQDSQIYYYIFSLRCLISVYQERRLPNHNTQNRWSKFQKTDFEKAARLYNSRRFCHDTPVEVKDSPKVTPSQLENWITGICLQALRNYNRQAIDEISIDTNIHRKESQKPEESAETIFEEESIMDLDSMIIHLDNQVEKSRTKIPIPYRKAVMLLCFHKFGCLLTDDFAHLVNVDQATVVRFRIKAYSKPLTELIEQKLHQYLKIKNPEIFFQARFKKIDRSNFIDRILLEALEEIKDDGDIEIIKRYFTSNEEKKYFPTKTIERIIKNLFTIFSKKLKDNYQKIGIKYLNNYFKKVFSKQLQGFFDDSLSSSEKELLVDFYLRKRTVDERKKETSINKLKNIYIDSIKSSFKLDISKFKTKIFAKIESWLTTIK